MSLKKSATRRLSLLAGSSLVAAGLATAAFTGVSLAPGQAFAYDECVPVAPTLSDGPNGVSDPTLNGATADTFTCTGTTFSTTGITYTSAGNLRANATGAIDVGAVGINLTGTGADTVTLSSTGALTGSTGPVIDLKSVNGAIIGTTTAVTATAGNAVLIGATGTGGVTFTATGTLTGTSGAILDIKTASGNITATTAGVVGTAAGVTNAVRLEATGAGNIIYTKTGTTAATAINNSAPGAEAAIAAISHGGNITMTIATGAVSFGTGTGVTGRLRGLLAETSGAGAVTLNVTGASGIIANPTDGQVAVDIVTGSGGADINLTTGRIGGRLLGGTTTVPFTDAIAIRVVSAGAVTIDNTAGQVVGAVDFSGVSAGGVRFDNVGTGSAGSGTNSYQFGGTWHMAGDSIFTSQNDTLILGGVRLHNAAIGSTVDFAGGVDTFNLGGIFATNGMTLSNLEAFNSSGTIYLGTKVNTNATSVLPNGVGEDILSMPGTTFTGSGASQLIVDVVLNGAAQVGCGAMIGAADCLDLRDGTTAGSTMLTINDGTLDATIGGYDPVGITLVDVSGSGSSAAEHFVLNPASTNGYVHPLYGPAIDRTGAFVYIFRYDAQNQRHVLVGQPRDRTLFEYAVLSGAAQSIWHMTTETVTDRQGELRRRGGTRSFWIRTSGEYSKRDVSTEFEGWDDTFAFDNSYKLYAGTIMGGVDLLTGASGDYDYVLGGQLGYVGSSLDLNASETNGKFTGATGGLYGSVWSDRMFVDAAFNLNGLALDFTSPALASKTTTYTNSVGARLDGGLRWMLGERTFLEPLASLAFARTSFEEVSLSVGEVQPAVANSRRGALGLRVGADLTEGPINVGYFVTGRAWNEFAGDNDGAVHNPGEDLPFSDELSGGFGEAEAGVNLFNDDGTLSGFLASGVKFKDGYNATTLSLGVRARW